MNCPLCGQPANLITPKPKISPSERVDRELIRRAEERLIKALEEYNDAGRDSECGMGRRGSNCD
jgi:hypothetical protein